jgi:hypothetical protein
LGSSAIDPEAGRGIPWVLEVSSSPLEYKYHNSLHYPSSCLLFKTQLNSIGLYLTGNTLRFSYETSRLMLSIGVWRWYINITITILDIMHRPVFYLKHDVSETESRINISPSQTHRSYQFIGTWVGQQVPFSPRNLAQKENFFELVSDRHPIRNSTAKLSVPSGKWQGCTF